MHRFFLSHEHFSRENVSFPTPLAHQLSRVLRLRRGDHIEVLDGSGWKYRVEIVELDRGGGSGRVIESSPCGGEAGIRINLFQSLLKGEKFEWVLQKGTELGISGFFPVVSRRCVVDRVSQARLERWRRIVREAAEQSGRGRLPSLARPLPLARTFLNLKGLSIIPWEGEKGCGLREVLPPVIPTRINIFIGPEGGFDRDEISLAREHGIIPIGLGPRILRSETAGLVTTAAILYHYGELG